MSDIAVYAGVGALIVVYLPLIVTVCMGRLFLSLIVMLLTCVAVVSTLFFPERHPANIAVWLSALSLAIAWPRRKPASHA